MEFDDRSSDRRGIDDAVAAALSYLDSVDPACAADAQFGWEGLRSVSPPGGPTQTSVQTFLWVHLRIVADGTDRARDIADALADLLDRLGHIRYADIARSSTTRELLDAETDPEWEQLYEEAMEESGIGPIDTRLITWQDAPEGAERAAVDLIGETLEVATVAGEFAPRHGGRPLGGRALATRRRGVVDAVLRTERAGGVLLEQLLDHRVALWTQYSPPRAELYRDLTAELHAASEPVYASVRRLEGFLDLIGDGVALTGSGYLPDNLVRKAVETLWTAWEWPFPAGTELETTPVLTVRRLLLRLGLVRRHRGRLLPTAKARGVSADRLWDIIVGRLVGTEYHPETIAAEAVLAEIVRGNRPSDTTELVSALLVAEGWTHSGLPPRAETVEPLAESVLAEMIALGAFSYVDDRRGLYSDVPTSDVPSTDGVRLAAAVLRHRLLHTRLPSP